MSVESLHQDFIERNGGLGVFKWIIEQDGFINPTKAKLYPIIAWNEYYHTDVVVIGSAYKYGDYFIVINYEEDLSNYPKKLKKWIEEVMDIAELNNIIEVFRDNHLVAVYDENMKMMTEWYADDLELPLTSFISYKNNIIFENEIILNKDVIEKNKDGNDFIENINNLLKEFLTNTTKYNPNYSNEIFKENSFFNPVFNNTSNYSKFFNNDFPNPPTIKVNSDEYDEEFKVKWA
jgi:hypothetical protein